MDKIRVINLRLIEPLFKKMQEKKRAVELMLKGRITWEEFIYKRVVFEK